MAGNERNQGVAAMTELKSITVRASGKCHPAVQTESGFVILVCTCPGSKNGKLANVATKIADGHDKANCRK
jgi:hypothetical protein